MDTNLIVTIVALLIAIVVAGIAFYRSGKPVTLEGVTETIHQAEPLAREIAEVAQVVVGGVQQLKETGQIHTGTEAFAKASDHLQHWFPGVDPARLVPFIEWAYRNVKRGAPPPPSAEDQILDLWRKEQEADAGKP